MRNRAESPLASLPGLAGLCIFIACGGLSMSGCASSQQATGDTTFTRTVDGSIVEVRLEEYQIRMPTEIPAGHTIFKISNTGSHDHNIKFAGPESLPEEDRIDTALPQNVKPGEVTELVLDLVPGTYKVTCPVGPHKTLGMRLDLTVTK